MNLRLEEAKLILRLRQLAQGNHLLTLLKDADGVVSVTFLGNGRSEQLNGGAVAVGES